MLFRNFQACELLYIFFVIYYIVEETIEIRQNGIAYFRGVWNLLDLGVIAVKKDFLKTNIFGAKLFFQVSLLNIALTLLAVQRVESDIGDLLGAPDKYADFSTLGFW